MRTWKDADPESGLCVTKYCTEVMFILLWGLGFFHFLAYFKNPTILPFILDHVSFLMCHLCVWPSYHWSPPASHYRAVRVSLVLWQSVCSRHRMEPKRAQRWFKYWQLDLWSLRQMTFWSRRDTFILLQVLLFQCQSFASFLWGVQEANHLKNIHGYKHFYLPTYLPPFVFLFVLFLHTNIYLV